MNKTGAIKKKKINWMRVSFIISGILLPTVSFLITYVYVNFDALFRGFYIMIGGERVWTLDNFITFFEEFSKESSDLLLCFGNTFKTWLISFITFPLGFLVSYFLYKKIFLFRSFRTIFFLPSVIPGVVIISVFTNFVGTEGPIAKMIADMIGEPYVELLGDERFANYTIWFNMIWLGFPGNMVLWGGSLARIPDSLLESAKLDGVSWLREVVSIIIPLVWPTFILMLMMNVSGIFGASGSVFLLTEGRWGTNTFSNWMYMNVLNNKDPNSNIYNYMAAVGLLITIISCALALTLNRLKKKFEGVDY